MNVDDQAAKEEACKIFGHKPGEEQRPATFAEMTVVGTAVACIRCGKKLYEKPKPQAL